jgi:hypothetical protein
MKKNTTNTNKFRGCPACGVMSFPPVLQPAEKKPTSNSTKSIEPVADRMDVDSKQNSFTPGK